MHTMAVQSKRRPGATCPSGVARPARQATVGCALKLQTAPFTRNLGHHRWNFWNFKFLSNGIFRIFKKYPPWWTECFPSGWTCLIACHSLSASLFTDAVWDPRKCLARESFRFQVHVLLQVHGWGVWVWLLPTSRVHLLSPLELIGMHTDPCLVFCF